MIFPSLYLISLLLYLPSSLFLLLIKLRISIILHYHLALHISTIYHNLWRLHLKKIWIFSYGNTRKTFCNYLHFIIVYNRYLAFFTLDSSFIFPLTSLSLPLSLSLFLSHSLSLSIPLSPSPLSLTSLSLYSLSDYHSIFSLFLPVSSFLTSLTSSLSLLFSLYLSFHSHPLSLTFPFLYFTDPICV